MYGAAVPSLNGGGHQGGRARGRLVLLGVRAGAVAVLEVDAQVLDGLALQLGADAVVDGPRELVGDAEDGGERAGVRGVLVEGGERLVAPGAQGARGEDVPGDVDGVNGLAGAGVARVAPGQVGVDLGESGSDSLTYGVRKARCHGLLLPHSTPSRCSRPTIEHFSV